MSFATDIEKYSWISLKESRQISITRLVIPLVASRNIVTTNKQESLNLKEHEEGCMRGFGRRKKNEGM